EDTELYGPVRQRFPDDPPPDPVLVEHRRHLQTARDDAAEWIDRRDRAARQLRRTTTDLDSARTKLDVIPTRLRRQRATVQARINSLVFELRQLTETHEHTRAKARDLQRKVTSLSGLVEDAETQAAQHLEQQRADWEDHETRTRNTAIEATRRDITTSLTAHQAELQRRTHLSPAQHAAEERIRQIHTESQQAWFVDDGSATNRALTHESSAEPQL
ncbi:hypothetical protein, partial [Nocardia sp. NPDC058497]|uniref:hypothetical protein n=1 Tax=Nocardia sp. NPDC058497 TaxID=3346529 RepID=UPI0036559C4A